MKAILYKELRENLPWAALILLITAALLAFVISEDIHTGVPLIEKTALTVAMLMYPAAGLALGMLQILQDFRRGRWQFVSHRPISSSKIFAAKLVVGIILYSSATLIPLVIAVAWVAVPGHVPGPFSMDMTTPILAYLCSGLMWYASGLLVASRNANWFGSRLMPLALPLLVMIVCNALAVSLIAALAITAIGLAILVIAAWGAFITGGDLSPIPGWSRPWVGLSIVAGWIMLIVFCMVPFGEAIRSLQRRPSVSYSNYVLGDLGELKTVSYGTSSEPGIYHITGNPAKEHWPYDLPLQTVNLNLFGFQPSLSHALFDGFLKRENHARRFTVTSNQNWYYVASRRTIEGFDSQTYEFLASLGPDGYAGPEAPLKPFPHALPARTQNWGNSIQNNILVFDDAVYFVDGDSRTISKIFTGEANDTVVAASYLQSDPTAELVVATQKFLHVLHGPNEELKVPIEHHGQQPEVTVGRIPKSNQLVIAYGVNRPAGLEPVIVTRYAKGGAIVSQTVVPTNAAKPDNYGLHPSWYLLGTMLPAPPAFFVLITVLHFEDSPLTFGMRDVELLCIIGVYMTIAFAMLRVRHASVLQMLVWIPLAAALGLAGVFLLISMLENPASVLCQGCGKRRLITEEKCPDCKTAADGPPMEGIEIFQSARVLSPVG